MPLRNFAASQIIAIERMSTKRYDYLYHWLSCNHICKLFYPTKVYFITTEFVGWDSLKFPPNNFADIGTLLPMTCLQSAASTIQIAISQPDHNRVCELFSLFAVYSATTEFVYFFTPFVL